jgi:hypothetical protein
MDGARTVTRCGGLARVARPVAPRRSSQTVRPGASRRWRARRRRVALALGAVVLGAATLPAPPAGADEGLVLLGGLPDQRTDVGFFGSFIPLVDDVGRRLFYLYQTPGSAQGPGRWWLRVYDLRGRMPRVAGEAPIATTDELTASATFSENTVALDTRRNRLLLLDSASTLAGCPGDLRCGRDVPSTIAVTIVDLGTLRRVAVWGLSARAPGFSTKGLAYSPEDDLIYMVGELGNAAQVSPSSLTAGFGSRSYPVAVVALHAEDGSLAWMRIVPECGIPMINEQTAHNGSRVVRDPHYPALYFACIRSTLSPETNALMRLWIRPDATTVEAARFPLEVFPISGTYTGAASAQGILLYDPGADRLFLQGQSETFPGAWVFDGRLSAWVGFVGAPNPLDVFAALNTRTGRYYLGGQPFGGDLPESYLVLTEGRQTPVPQGRLFFTGGVASVLRVDPTTGHLFLWREEPRREWLVFEDRLEAFRPPAPPDYDELTSDVAEGPGTVTSFAASVDGFGARALLVGGKAGILDPFCLGTNDPVCQSEGSVERAALGFNASGADRGLFAARVSSADLRNVSASASARALELDPTSEGEYVSAVRNEADRVRVATGNSDELDDERREREEGLPDDNDDPGDALERSLAWRYDPAFCLDSGARPTSGRAAGVSVSCDLAAQRVRATSSHDGLSLGGVSVASASFVTEVLRDPGRGAMTVTTALARGVRLQAPGGTARIGEVRATAITAARGRRGTAEVTWVRRLAGVAVEDASGRTVYSCADERGCDPKAAIAAINGVLGFRLRVRLPEPLLVRAPSGAFAAVEEREADFLDGLVVNNDPLRAVPALEVVVYNDNEDKSRVVVQLAAIQASSIYGVKPLPGTEPPETGPPTERPLPRVEPPALPVPVIDGVLPVAPPGGPGGPVARIVRSALLLLRSPREALLFGMAMLVFAGAAAALWRRRALLHQVT